METRPVLAALGTAAVLALTFGASPEMPSVQETEIRLDVTVVGGQVGPYPADSISQLIAAESPERLRAWAVAWATVGERTVPWFCQQGQDGREWIEVEIQYDSSRLSLRRVGGHSLPGCRVVWRGSVFGDSIRLLDGLSEIIIGVRYPARGTDL